MQPEKKQRKKFTIVAISDTHSSQKQLQKVQHMKGDIFIHAGDFTSYGKQENFLAFFEFLDTINFTHKIVICGNHEIPMDTGFMAEYYRNKFLQKQSCKLTRQEIKEQLKKRCIYLEHEYVQIEGIKIFGSPYTPLYCNTAFQYKPELDKQIWKKIPNEIDILITHCPPYGILDKTHKGHSCGSKHLAQVSLAIKPIYHIFGHIHQSSGCLKSQGIRFVNVAKKPTCLIFRMKNPPN